VGSNDGGVQISWGQMTVGSNDGGIK
jgi:hypothetical protein